MICALFVSVFTNTMVNVAIPLIRDQFGASEAQSGWVITGYALAFAVSIPLYGRASSGSSSITRQDWGSVDDKPVSLYTLSLTGVR